MKTEIKQVDGLLTITGSTMEKEEKELLKEFFQKEIPGYDHSLNYSYDDETDSFKIRFVPVISRHNLEKEYGEKVGQGSKVTVMGDYWIIYVSTLSIRIHKLSHAYKIIAGNGLTVIEEGHVDHIYKLRSLLQKMNGYAGVQEYQ